MFRVIYGEALGQSFGPYATRAEAEHFQDRLNHCGVWALIVRADAEEAT